MLMWFKVFLFLLLSTPSWAGLPPTRILDEGVDKGVAFKFDCVGAGIVCSQSGVIGTLTVDGGAGGGDEITVNTTAATNANLLDNLYIDWAIDTAATPDDITSKFNYAETLAGNPELLVDECILFKDTSGGGFICEGSTADTLEQAFRFPDVNVEVTRFMMLDDTSITSIDDVSLEVSAGILRRAALTGDITATSGSNTTEIAVNSVALTTDTTGNYAAGDAEAGAALTGDSATAFFASGTIEDARLPTSMADKVITGSLAVPQGTNPTVDAAGEVAVDTSATVGSGIRFYGDAAYTLPGYFSKSLVITGATTASDSPFWRTPWAITIKAVHCLIVGGTNVVGQLDEYDSNGANPVVVDSADITCTTTNANDDGTLSNPSVDAGDYLGWHTTSISGTNTRTIITWEFTVDGVN